MRSNYIYSRRCRRKISQVVLAVWLFVIFLAVRMVRLAYDSDTSTYSEDERGNLQETASVLRMEESNGNEISSDSDGRKIVNRYSFPVLLEPEGICQDPDLFLIIYIHSAPGYASRRDHIRKTWGNPVYHKIKFRLFFVFGLVNGTDSVRIQQEIEAESRKYKDILQAGFIDTYRNLSYKALAALKWIDVHCEQVNYVFKADDDTFVNTFAFLKHLKSLETTGVSTKNTIICNVHGRMKVLRKGKWKVDTGHYNASFYPKYCSGCAFTFTADVASAIYRESYHVPFLWVDDAYITGVIPEAIGTVSFLNLAAAYQMNSDKLVASFTQNNSSKTFLFSSDIHRYEEAVRVWNYLLAPIFYS